MGAPSGFNRVIRGGNWNNDTSNVRSVNRNNNPNNRNNNIGFRVSLPQPDGDGIHR